MTKRAPKPSPDNPEQFKRFLQTARDVEASEDPKDLDEAFMKIVVRKGPEPNARKR